MSINYSVIYSERKTLSIIIERDRSVVVRAPFNTSEEQIAKEVEKRKRAILKRIEHNRTRAAEGGANLKDIQEIMDHSDINTTMRYVHATDPGKRRAVEAAARVSKVESLASHLPHKKTATG